MRLAWIVVAALLGAILAAAAVTYVNRHESGEGREAAVGDPVAPAEEKVPVHIYFLSRGGEYLSAEKREIEALDSAVQETEALLNILLKGPEAAGLRRCMPEKTRLLAVYVKNGAAFVDLSVDAVNGDNRGAWAEHLAVFSIVNTICLNVKDVSAVKILIQGREIETFHGHVDLRRPLQADMTIIR